MASPERQERSSASGVDQDMDAREPTINQMRWSIKGDRWFGLCLLAAAAITAIGLAVASRYRVESGPPADDVYFVASGGGGGAGGGEASGTALAVRSDGSKSGGSGGGGGISGIVYRITGLRIVRRDQIVESEVVGALPKIEGEESAIIPTPREPVEHVIDERIQGEDLSCLEPGAAGGSADGAVICSHAGTDEPGLEPAPPGGRPASPLAPPVPDPTLSGGSETVPVFDLPASRLPVPVGYYHDGQCVIPED